MTQARTERHGHRNQTHNHRTHRQSRPSARRMPYGEPLQLMVKILFRLIRSIIKEVIDTELRQMHDGEQVADDDYDYEDDFSEYNDDNDEDDEFGEDYED